MTENEMVGWHHQLNGNEFEQAPEDGEGQGGLVGCSPWDPKESDMAEQLNNNNKIRSRNKKKSCTARYAGGFLPHWQWDWKELYKS